jgi:hypothetical protein
VSDARLFTSESVTEGHPDKICDAISDSVLDALLAQDPKSRVAVETLVTTGQVHVVGEVTTTAKEAFAYITNTVRSASQKSNPTRRTRASTGDLRRTSASARVATSPRASPAHEAQWGRRRSTPRAPATGPDVRLRDQDAG